MINSLIVFSKKMEKEGKKKMKKIKVMRKDGISKGRVDDKGK